MKPEDLKQLEAGGMPYGLFAAFVQENAQLARVCKSNKVGYGTILAMYKAAIKAYLADRSAVAVDGPADKAGLADEAAPHARVMYHTPRQTVLQHTICFPAAFCTATGIWRWAETGRRSLERASHGVV